MTTDASWPRTGTWPGARTFDRVTAIVQMQASTTPAQVTRLDYDPETRTTTPSLETHHTPAPTGSFTGPTLGRDEAWFIYTILWKPYACTIDEATAAPIPADMAAMLDKLGLPLPEQRA
ncbi:MAG: hypothetical protein NT062_15490 [Proteobacteria bacterium]|nr:hypothetical protein [Pseudomonadota bacterium]